MGRTNMELDDRLVAEAMELTGARTSRQAVDIVLRAYPYAKPLEPVEEPFAE